MQSYYAGKAKQGRDDYETPAWCWRMIVDLINNKQRRIWEPFYCKGLAGQTLAELGQPCIHENKDFFSWEPEEWDCIVSNPPYSIKQSVFERCIALGKPFALYVPLDTLGRKYISRLMNSPYLQIVIPNARTDFITDYEVNRTCPPHLTIWICWKMKLRDGSQIIFS